MKVRIFQADKGDCMLLSSKDNSHMLIDGGMATSFNEHVAKYLSRYIQKLDRVCVTHIDQDHIHGILEMCEHIIDWRVYEYQKSIGNTKYKKPKNPKPPEISSFWHNSFAAQFGEDSEALASAAQALSTVFSIGENKINSDYAESLTGIATSQRQGYLLSQKLSKSLLNIPINPESNGELLVFNSNDNVFPLGDITIRLIAPFKTDIDDLREEWNKWVNSVSGTKATEKIDKEIERKKSKIQATNAVTLKTSLQEILIEFTENLEKWNKKRGELGKRNNVTLPNLASIMFIAEEDKKKMLFTGDGHWQDIEKGIRQDGTYNPDQGIHFDVIKVPHHGSEHNTNIDFWRKFTADDYIFCSDGSHENPDTRILEKIIQSRKEDKDVNHPHSGKPYKFWFNSSDVATKPSNKTHMKEVRSMVRRRAKQSKGRMRYQFLNGHSFMLEK